MFQDARLAGLLFLAAIAVESLALAAAALAGSVAASCLASAVRADRGLLRAGMFGFNGALSALAMIHFLAPGSPAWAVAILASCGSTILMLALTAGLARWKLPALTAPFVLTTLAALLASAHLGGLLTAHRAEAGASSAVAAPDGAISAATLGEGVLNGVAQVFFLGNPVSGLLLVAGLLVASRRASAAALMGSLIGFLAGRAMGAPEAELRAGAFGFNSALCAIALASVLLVPGRRAQVHALLAAVLAPCVGVGCSAALGALGLPALTLPFVLTTWTFLLLDRFVPAEAALTDGRDARA